MSMTDMEIMKNVTEIGTVTAREDAAGGAGAGEGCGGEGEEEENLEVDAHARSMHKEGEHQVLSTSSLFLCILCAKIILFANKKLIHIV